MTRAPGRDTEGACASGGVRRRLPGRRVEAALRPSGWQCVAAGLPGQDGDGPALQTGEIAILSHSAHLRVETCRSLAAVGSTLPATCR